MNDAFAKEASPSRAAVYAAGVLMAAYVSAFLDRQILALLVDPVKQDLGLDDTEASLLLGFSFAVLMAVAGLPIGRLVDTRRRTAIVAAGIGLWSVMTLACGLSQNYSQLLLARMGVGLGEACLAPAAYSMLADYFPPRRHGLVFGIFGTAAFAGLGLSYIIGGEVIRHLDSHPAFVLPDTGEVAAWRLAFIAVGLLGLPIAAWAATLREPARGAGHQAQHSLAQALDYFRAQWRPIVLVNLAVAFAAMAGYSLSAWLPTLFIRSYGWSASEIGHRFGAAVLLAGALGYVTGGWAGDRRVRTGAPGGRLVIVIGAALAAIPPILAAPLMSDPWFALALYGLAVLPVSMAIGLGPAVQLDLVPREMRGLAIALGVLFVNLLGLGLGPTVVAVVTNTIIGDEDQVRLALAGTLPVMLLFSAGIGALALRPSAHCIHQRARGHPDLARLGEHRAQQIGQAIGR